MTPAAMRHPAAMMTNVGDRPMLPFMKGAVIGIAWANGVTRETARQ